MSEGRAHTGRRSHGSPFTFHTTVTNPSMSTSKAKAKAATNPPLSLEDTLHDMAVIRSSDIDLAAILASAIPAPSAVSPTGTAPWTAAPAADVDASVARSHEFAQAARAAIKIKNRGDVEAQGERVNEVRGQLEEVVEGLVGDS
ncbi:hypothetical protein BGY98DRAFT_966409 [Russula aff. rugulosa BPL654]|nr:hypothetical protein BGY98DRAFT_966409 [Russula aff. rugulosa BPL654]